MLQHAREGPLLLCRYSLRPWDLGWSPLRDVVSDLIVTQMSCTTQASHPLTSVIAMVEVARVAVTDHLQGKALDTATCLHSVSSKTTSKTSTSRILTHLIARHLVIAKLCVADALGISPVSCNCAISSLASTLYVAGGVRDVPTKDPSETGHHASRRRFVLYHDATATGSVD